MRNSRLITGALIMYLLLWAPAHSTIDGESWFPLGPAPINNFFGGGVTGRASAIAVNPANLDELWIGTAAGGVWHTVDHGQNWRPISDDQAALAIGALAVDGCGVDGCQTIYAGTGENAIRRDTYYGRGLLIFDQVGEFPVWGLSSGTPFNFSLGSINDVVLDPSTSGSTKRVFVTLSSGTTNSASQTTVTAPEPTNGMGQGGYGIYRSDDMGGTWTKLVIPGADGQKPTDLEMDPGNPQLLYAGFLGTGVFKSTDGGNTWCPLNEGIALPLGCPDPAGLDPDVPGGFDHVEIAIHQADPQTIFVTTGHCDDRLIQSCTPSVFRTENGGDNWTKRRQGTTTGSAISCPTIYSRYTHALAVHPTNPDILLLGGTRFCRSSDGGANFGTSDNNLAPGGSPWGPIIHLDHREVVYHPLNASRVYSTDDGGFAFSTNGGIDWTPGNEDLQITGFYSLTSSPNTPRVLGGAQDNAGQLWMGGRAWELVGGGDGGYAIIDRDDPMRLYLGSNFGSLTRSTNGGLTFGSITPPGDSAFNAPVVQDAAPPHALYYGGDALFRSFDDGTTWPQVSPVLATGVVDEITAINNVITAIGVRGSRVYIGYYGGEVFTSNAVCNDLSCWTNVSAGLPAAPVTDIAVNPDNGNIAYLAFSGFGNSAHVWKTTNAGSSWMASATGLPTGVPANALAIEADTTSRVWVGLDSGPLPDRSNIYRSSNSGGSWEPLSRGIPNAPVHDLSIDDSRGRIYAGLHGRGAYVLGEPSVGVFEGWVNGSIWDVPIFGSNFPANQNCTVSLLQQTGDVCASSTLDGIGGTIQTNATGNLTTSNGSFWGGKLVVWGCLNGACIGGTPIAQCNDDANGDGVDDPLSTVVVDCGGTPGVATIPGCPALTNPPGSLIDVGFFEVARESDSASILNVTRRGVRAAKASQFLVAASLQSREGAEFLCSAPVAVAPGDDPAAILTQARDAINNQSACKQSGVVAELDETAITESEDFFARTPGLYLSGPTLVGGQVVAGIRANPAEVGLGSCFTVRGLGNAMYSQLRIMRSTFTTPPEGASGGSITYVENTGLGICAVTMDTHQGQLAGDIAQALEDLILDTDNPDSKPYCREKENSRSVNRDGDSLISVYASSIQICLQDSGVGFTLLPEEIDPDDFGTPPVCDDAQPSVAELWPPNKKFHDVEINNVIDPDGGDVAVTITGIRQDEPVSGHGTGRKCPDGRGVGDAVASLRAERSGRGDGRIYHVEFEAEDEQSLSCTGQVAVCVPHDQGGGDQCIDQGPLFDSTDDTC